MDKNDKISFAVKQIDLLLKRIKKSDIKMSSEEFVKLINNSDIINDDVIESIILTLLELGNMSIDDLIKEINYSIIELNSSIVNLFKFSYPPKEEKQKLRIYKEVNNLSDVINHFKIRMSKYSILIAPLGNLFNWHYVKKSDAFYHDISNRYTKKYNLLHLWRDINYLDIDILT